MSATMASQEGRVQLEQSDMCLVMNMAKMAKGGFARTAVQEMEYLIEKPHVTVREQKKWGVEFSGPEKVKAAIVRHSAMLHHNQTGRCLPCQNGNAKNRQTHSRHKATGAPVLMRCTQRTPDSTPPVPQMRPLPESPPAPNSNHAGAQHSQIVNMPA
jgi:hypothetical protein